MTTPSGLRFDPLPQWLPLGVVEYIKRSIENKDHDAEYLAVAGRLVHDLRMKEVWSTFLETDRQTGAFSYSFPFREGSSIHDAICRQQQGCALIFHMTLGLAASGSEQLTTTEVEREVDALHRAAENLRNAVAVCQRHGLLGDQVNLLGERSAEEMWRRVELLSYFKIAAHPIGDGGVFTTDCRDLVSDLATKLDQRATRLPADWAGLTAERRRDDMRLKLLTNLLCDLFRQTFGKSLNGTAANLASVALGVEKSSVAAAKKASQRRR